MPDPISVSCLILLLWLVVRDLSRKKFRPEPPLLPQHQDNVRYTVPLYAVEQQSVNEHQCQDEEALPTKARYVHLEHELVASAKPLETVPLSVPSAPQERNKTRSQALPESGQSSIIAPQPFVSLTNSGCLSTADALQRGTVQIDQVTDIPLTPGVDGEGSSQVLPQQINKLGQSPILVPQPSVSPTDSVGQATLDISQWGSVQIHQILSTPLVPDVSGVSSPPQDDLEEGGNDYAKLRERAKEEVEAIRKCRKEKKQAGANGQSKLAKELAKEVKIHRQRRQLFDEQACTLIFAKNNKNRSPGMVDLHGLTAEEAATHAKRAISDVREKGYTEIRFIVGKGLHSSGPPVLKPAILKVMKKLKISAEIDPSNEGVLVVQLPPTKELSLPVVAQEQDLMLPQPSSPLTSQLGQSLVLFSEAHEEPGQQIDDASQSPVENCQAAPAPDVDEELSQLPRISNMDETESDNVTKIQKRAKEEKKMKLHYRKEKKAAKALGQTALAKQMAQKESEHKNRSKSLSEQASKLVFAKHNKSCPPNKAVLLDLKAKDAKKFAKVVIQKAREQGITELRLVVGDGPPSLLKFLRQKRGFPVQIDPINKGVLVVSVSPSCVI